MSDAIFIVAAGSDLAIAVFLYEGAVPSTV